VNSAVPELIFMYSLLPH